MLAGAASICGRASTRSVGASGSAADYGASVIEIGAHAGKSVYAVNFSTPVAVLVGVVIGHVLTRRGAHELDRRSTREEAMRMLRWASELAAEDDSARTTLG